MLAMMFEWTTTRVLDLVQETLIATSSVIIRHSEPAITTKAKGELSALRNIFVDSVDGKYMHKKDVNKPIDHGYIHNALYKQR